MPFCIECGKQIPDGMTFCPYCGADQSAAVPNAADAHSQDTAQRTALASDYQPTPTRKRRVWIPILVGCCFAVIIGGFLAFYLMDPLGVFGPSDEGAVEGTVVEESADPASTSSSPTVSAVGEDDLEQDEEASKSANLGYGNLTDDYILPEGSTRYYTRSELDKLDSRTLWYARNEMYAKHGKGFRTEELKRYFESKPWYVELYTADEFDDLPEQLNSYELANEELMTKIEEERDSPYLH